MGKASRRKHTQLVKTGTTPLGLVRTRPANSIEIVRRISERTNCQDCAYCCKHPRELMVMSQDPHATDVARAILSNRVPETHVVYEHGGIFFTFPDGKGCFFLEEPNACKIYIASPSCCKWFPFTFDVGTAMLSRVTRERKMVAFLTTHCPAVQAIKDEGVEIVLASDLVVENSTLANPVGIGFLGKSLISLLDPAHEADMMFFSRDGFPPLILFDTQDIKDIAFLIV